MNGIRTKIIELKQDGTEKDGKGRNELNEDFIHNRSLRSSPTTKVTKTNT
jgi:hypothetical protein